MTQIDPMIVPMPDKWESDPDIQPFIDYWLRFSYAMWEAVTSATGVSTIENYVYEGSTEKTTITDAEPEIELLQHFIRTNDLQEQIDELQTECFNKKHDTDVNFDKRYGFMMS